MAADVAYQSPSIRFAFTFITSRYMVEEVNQASTRRIQHADASIHAMLASSSLRDLLAQSDALPLNSPLTTLDMLSAKYCSGQRDASAR